MKFDPLKPIKDFTKWILDDTDNYHNTPPRIRRIIMLSGWAIFLYFPMYIVTHNIIPNGFHAAIYATMSAPIGVGIGFYFYNRGKEDINKLPVDNSKIDMLKQLLETVIKSKGGE
jgi:hypothetical protein